VDALESAGAGWIETEVRHGGVGEADSSVVLRGPRNSLLGLQIEVSPLLSSPSSHLMI
jgi:hypothetical protein